MQGLIALPRYDGNIAKGLLDQVMGVGTYRLPQIHLNIRWSLDTVI